MLDRFMEMRNQKWEVCVILTYHIKKQINSKHNNNVEFWWKFNE